MKAEIKWMATAAILCAVYVTLGAFGAHGLEDVLSEKDMKTYQTGLRYMIIHGLGMLLINAIGLLLNKKFIASNILFSMGIIFFSFSLIIHACKVPLGINIDVFAMLAPFGGLCFVAGWIAFTYKLIRS